MALSGDWVTLRVNNVRYLEKAPLPYWIVAASLRPFGVNAFAVHLPQALCVLLLMLLGVRWARQAFGQRAALYTGLAVLTSAGVFLFTRVFLPDVLLSLLLATALYCLLQSLNPSQPQVVAQKNNVVILSEGARAPARELQSKDLLLKIPGAPFMAQSHRDMGGLYPYLSGPPSPSPSSPRAWSPSSSSSPPPSSILALTGELRNWRRLKPFSGALLFLAIAAPWHILAGLRNTGGLNGHGFFWFYFINEHVLRFLGRRIPRDYNKLPSTLYWSLHLVWLFPMSLFFPLLVSWANLRSGISLHLTQIHTHQSVVPVLSVRF